MARELELPRRLRREGAVIRAAFLAAALAAFAFAAHAVPFWGAKSSMPADTDPAKLKPGEFVWEGEAVSAGPIVVVVSLVEQRANVYRNGVRVGVSTASTGKPGHRTPTGVFTVLQKDADHHSKTYNNAAMPYTERLTWDGVALHAGGLPAIRRRTAACTCRRSSRGSVRDLAHGHDRGDRRRPQRAERGRASRGARAGRSDDGPTT